MTAPHKEGTVDAFYREINNIFFKYGIGKLSQTQACDTLLAAVVETRKEKCPQCKGLVAYAVKRDVDGEEGLYPCPTCNAELTITVPITLREKLEEGERLQESLRIAEAKIATFGTEMMDNTMKLEEENGRLRAALEEIGRLRVLVHMAEARAREMEIAPHDDSDIVRTICAHCGLVIPGSSKDALLEHQKVCEKHPMRALEAEIKQVRAIWSRYETGKITGKGLCAELREALGTGEGGDK